MSDELIGQSIGPYRIMETIGKSGAGRLYRAEQTGSGRMVALQVLPAEFLSEAAFVAEFPAQAVPLTRLQHPNIVPVIEAAIADGFPYLAFGFVKGQSLSDRLDKMPGGLSPAEAARILTQIATAVDYAHRTDLLHRNIKPANILLDHRGVASLTNFGLPVVSEARSHHAGKRYIGTPAYMAPEITTGDGISRLSDLYALAATFFHSLATRPPFDSGNQVAVLLAHVQQPVPTIREYRSDLPLALQPIIERALAKDPADRYQTASEFADSVETVIQAMGPEAARAPQSVGDPLSTGRVEPAPAGKISSTTIQIKPSRVKLPPLSPQELGVQTAGRRRPDPSPADTEKSEAAAPAAKPTVVGGMSEAAAPAAKPTVVDGMSEAAAPAAKPTIVGGMSQADIADAAAPTGRETVPADISRASVQAAKQAAPPTLTPPASPPQKRNGRLLIVVGVSILAVCLIAAAALILLYITGVFGG